jgi:hypothetical protein
MGARHYHLPEPLFLYHQHHQTQMSGDARAVWRSHIEIYENLVKSGLLGPSDARLARRAIRRCKLKLSLRWDMWGIPARRKLARMSAS